MSSSPRSCASTKAATLRVLFPVPRYDAYVPRYGQEGLRIRFSRRAGCVWPCRAAEGGAKVADGRRRRREGGRAGRPGDRSGGERFASARRQARGLSLGQIAKEVGLARSTVQRIVAALATEDFVTEAQPGHGVRIGQGLRASRLAELQRRRDPSSPSRRLARRGRRNRRSLDSVGRFGRVHRPDSGSAAPGRALSDRRALPPALHRQRQGDPRLLSPRRTRSPDRQECRRTSPIIRSRIAPSFCGS